jgi:hypothetical protein
VRSLVMRIALICSRIERACIRQNAADHFFMPVR